MQICRSLIQYMKCKIAQKERNEAATKHITHAESTATTKATIATNAVHFWPVP